MLETPEHPIGVAIVDKNPLVVRGLKSLFAEDGRFELVASASDGERLLEGLGQFRMDVLVTGWVMPYCNGRELLRGLGKREGAPRVIIYTGDLDRTIPRIAMKLGAAGFCSKSDPPEHLLEVIDAVARGTMVFPFFDIAELTDDPMETLTPRERELLEALAQGHTNNEIAARLGVSTNTVKFHLRNLYEKLSVRNRAEAAAMAVARAASLQVV